MVGVAVEICEGDADGKRDERSGSAEGVNDDGEDEEELLIEEKEVGINVDKAVLGKFVVVAIDVGGAVVAVVVIVVGINVIGCSRGDSEEGEEEGDREKIVGVLLGGCEASSSLVVGDSVGGKEDSIILSCVGETVGVTPPLLRLLGKALGEIREEFVEDSFPS